MEEHVVRRGLRLIAAGGIMVALDVPVAGFDVVSDAVGLALAIGGVSGLMRLPAATGEALAMLRTVRAVTLVALLGSALSELRPGSVPMTASVVIRIAPLLAFNGLCLAMWRLTTASGRPRAAEAWRTTLSAVVTMLDVPAAVLVAAVAAGQASMPSGSVGAAIGVVGVLCAAVPLLHLLVVALPRTVEHVNEPLARVIHLPQISSAASERAASERAEASAR